VFRLENFAVPEHWSQVAADILAQKYFRKAGVPARLMRLEETQVPSWLWRSAADERSLAELPEKTRITGETDARQVFDRLAGTWTYWGWKGGYFDSEADAQAFFDEHRYMLAMQMSAPNSPQWFNTGLHWAYGIDGPGQGHWFVDHRDGGEQRRGQHLWFLPNTKAAYRAYPGWKRWLAGYSRARGAREGRLPVRQGTTGAEPAKHRYRQGELEHRPPDPDRLLPDPGDAVLERDLRLRPHPGAGHTGRAGHPGRRPVA
jgi:hypothetical protein